MAHVIKTFKLLKEYKYDELLKHIKYIKEEYNDDINNYRDNKSNTILHLLCKYVNNRKIDIISNVLEYVDPNCLNIYEEDCIHVLLKRIFYEDFENNTFEILKIIINKYKNKNYNPNQESSRKFTYLHYLIESLSTLEITNNVIITHNNILIYLIANGSDVNYYPKNNKKKNYGINPYFLLVQKICTQKQNENYENITNNKIITEYSDIIFNYMRENGASLNYVKMLYK